MGSPILFWGPYIPGTKVIGLFHTSKGYYSDSNMRLISSRAFSTVPNTLTCILPKMGLLRPFAASSTILRLEMKYTSRIFGCCQRGCCPRLPTFAAAIRSSRLSFISRTSQMKNSSSSCASSICLISSSPGPPIFRKLVFGLYGTD